MALTLPPSSALTWSPEERVPLSKWLRNQLQRGRIGYDPLETDGDLTEIQCQRTTQCILGHKPKCQYGFAQRLTHRLLLEQSNSQLILSDQSLLEE